MPEPLGSVSLGRAIDLSATPNDVKNNQCFPVAKHIRILNWRSSRTFHAMAWRGEDRPVNLYEPYSTTSGSDPLADIDLRTHFEPLHDGTKEKAFQLTLLELQTVSRSTSTAREDPRQTHCLSPHDWNHKDFRDTCGTAYIQNEVLGGYILLSREIDPSLLEERGSPDSTLKLGRFAGLRDPARHPHEPFFAKQVGDAHVTGYGIEPPPDDVLADGLLSPTELNEYQHARYDAFSEALERDALDHPSYGAVVDRNYATYSLGQLDDCIL